MTSVGVRANTRFLLSEGSEARALRLRSPSLPRSRIVPLWTERTRNVCLDWRNHMGQDHPEAGDGDRRTI